MTVLTEDDFSKLSEGVVNWNIWREQNRNIAPRLRHRKIDRELPKVDLRGATLIGVDLSGLNLRQADFNGATLLNCDFNRADLSGADFSRSSCKQTSFKNSTL